MKEGNVYLTTHSELYLRLYGVIHTVEDHSDSDMGYFFRLAVRVLLYASSHRQDNTYHSLCYTSSGAVAGTSDKRDQLKERESQRLPKATGVDFI